jgi:hypothetical protein
MRHKSSRVAIAVGTIALALALGSSAHAARRWAVSTPSLGPDPDGYLECKGDRDEHGTHGDRRHHP